MKIDKQKLSIAMADACMSTVDLALASGVSQNSIAKYLCGARNPKIKTIGKISKALNVSVEYLIDTEIRG